VDLSTKLYGRRSRAVGSALVNMSNAARWAGRYEESRVYIEEAISIYVEVFGEDHPKMGGAHVVLADLEEQTDHLPEARKHYLRGIEILEAHYGEEHPNVAGAMQNLGGVYVRENDMTGALELFHKALAIGEKVLGEDHPQTVMSRTDYGATLTQLGRAREAVPLLRTALQQRLVGPEDPVGLAHTRFALAQALWARGERVEALELARAAKRIYEERPELEDRRASELRNWLSTRA